MFGGVRWRSDVRRCRKEKVYLHIVEVVMALQARYPRME